MMKPKGAVKTTYWYETFSNCKKREGAVKVWIRKQHVWSLDSRQSVVSQVKNRRKGEEGKKDRLQFA